MLTTKLYIPRDPAHFLAYLDNPTALHLRAMNMLFEGLQERGR